jgi:hypothetical protein
VHEELESPHFVVIVRFRREVQLAEGLTEHFLVGPWVRVVLFMSPVKTKGKLGAH